MLGEICVLREGYPSHLNAVKVARDFLAVYDIKKSVMLRKVKSGSVDTPAIASNNPPRKYKKREYISRPGFPEMKINEPEDFYTKVNSVALYKEKIIGIYRKMPEKFTSIDVVDYISSVYPELAIPSRHTKARAYLKYCVNEDLFEVTRSGKRLFYKFTTAPFNTEKPAQSDFDPVVMHDQKLRELDMMRRTN